MFRLNTSLIRRLFFERGLTIAEFARQTRLNALTARKAIGDDATATPKVIHALAEFFGIDADALILKGAE